MIQYRFDNQTTQNLAYRKLLEQGMDKLDIIKICTKNFYDIIVLDGKIQPSKNEFESFIIAVKK